jgi:hypothetical protein
MKLSAVAVQKKRKKEVAVPCVSIYISFYRIPDSQSDRVATDKGLVRESYKEMCLRMEVPYFSFLYFPGATHSLWPVLSLSCVWPE